MSLKSDISKHKKVLMKKVDKNGLYENFGQAEVDKLRDKHIDTSDYSTDMNSKRLEINLFDDWCQNYTG